MENSNIQELAALLYRSGTADTIQYVRRRLAEMDMTMTDLYQHMEMTCSYLNIYRDENYASLTSPIHTHPFVEIIYCHSNCGAGYLLDTQHFTLQRGDILIIPPGLSHASLRNEDTDKSYSGYTLWINADYMAELSGHFPFFLQDTGRQGVFIRTAGTVWEYLGDLFRGLYMETSLEQPGWESAVSSISTLLLTQLTRATMQTEASSLYQEKDDLLNQVLAYIHAHLSDKITLDDLAAKFWVSSSTISHLFSKTLGISFYKYVTQRRLAEAKNLIREGMSLEQVANRVGFCDYSAFYRAFKKEFGCAPRQYQQASESDI